MNRRSGANPEGPLRTDRACRANLEILVIKKLGIWVDHCFWGLSGQAMAVSPSCRIPLSVFPRLWLALKTPPTKPNDPNTRIRHSCCPSKILDTLSLQQEEEGQSEHHPEQSRSQKGCRHNIVSLRLETPNTLAPSGG